MTSQDYQNQIYNTVIQQGYPDTLAKIIVAQAQHESADFKSDVFVKSNNPFGMTYNGQVLAGVSAANQPTKEGGLSYAGYPDVSVATLDLIAWLNRRQAKGAFNISDLTTPDIYAQALSDAGYYTDSESTYSKGLSYYYNKTKDFIITNATTSPVATYSVAGAILVAGVAAVWFGIALVIKNRKK